jgi:hypothetical protein
MVLENLKLQVNNRSLDWPEVKKFLKWDFWCWNFFAVVEQFRGPFCFRLSWISNQSKKTVVTYDPGKSSVTNSARLPNYVYKNKFII